MRVKSCALIYLFLLRLCKAKAPCKESGYELLGPGRCHDYVYLSVGSYPPLLSHSDPLFDDDRVQECMNRCLHENSKCKAFYLKDYEFCACASSNCSSPSGSNYTSYKVVGGTCTGGAVLDRSAFCANAECARSDYGNSTSNCCIDDIEH